VVAVAIGWFETFSETLEKLFTATTVALLGAKNYITDNLDDHIKAIRDLYDQYMTIHPKELMMKLVRSKVRQETGAKPF